MFISFVSYLAIKLFVCGFVLHLFCDWILQNHWMAQNKSSLKHSAAYVHSGLHFLGLLLIFPWYAALIIAILHLLIDTRVPLAFWRGFFRQTQEGDVALHIQIWSDQVTHVVVLAIVALMIGG